MSNPRSLPSCFMLFMLGLLSGRAIVTAGEPLLKKVDVFTARENGYHHFRIPGIVVTSKGTVLAYCEARKRQGDWSDIDIVWRRSTDGGSTWEALQVLADGEGISQSNPVAERYRQGDRKDDITCNNAVMFVDRDESTIHCLYCVEYARCFYTKSLDDGRSFQKPREITKAFQAIREQYPWKVLATGPGHGIQLTSGRLLIPVWLSTGEGGGAHRPSCVTTLYSDDAGTTWQTGEIVVNHPTLKNPSESVAVQLKNGVVMLNIRNENPERRRAVAFSRDGAGGWTRVEFVEQLYEPTCMASSIRYPHPSDKQRSLVLFANPDSRTIPANQRAPGGRQRLTVRLSSDDARTWPLSRVLEEGPSGYSDLAQQGDGSVLCFYERSPKGGSAADPQALTLARFNLDWLAHRERRAEKNKKDGN